MNQNDAVFNLVKSLTPSEKRFFRLQAREGKNYLLVFKALDSIKEYNFDLLKRKLKGKKMNISYEKNYLQRMILKALRNYGQDKFPLSEIAIQIQDIDILYQKGLHSQAETALNRAKEIALKYEYFTFNLELLNLERKIYLRHKNEESLGKSIKITEEMDLQMKLLQNRMVVDKVNANLIVMNTRYGQIYPKKAIKELEKLCTKGIMKDKKNMLSISSLKMFYTNLAVYYWHKDELTQMCKMAEANVRLHEQYPEIIEKEPQGYSAPLYNLALVSFNQKKYDRFFIYLNKIKSFAETSNLKLNQSLLANIFERSANFEIAYFLNTGKFMEGRAIIPKIKEGISKYRKLLGKEFIYEFYFAFAKLCFGAGEYREAIKNLQDIVNDKKVAIAKDLILYSKILLVIIHYELGNNDLIGYLSRLFKNTEMKEREQAIVAFFLDTLSRVERKNKIIAAMKKFKQLISSYPPSTFFDMVSWLDCKIEGKNFAEVVRDKSG